MTTLADQISRLSLPPVRVGQAQSLQELADEVNRANGKLHSYLRQLRDLLARSGIAGPQGEQGPTGPAGADGADGTNAAVRSAEVALSADQASLSDGDVVEFDQIGGTLFDDGDVTLPSNGTIRVAGGLRLMLIPGIRPTFGNQTTAWVRAFWQTAASGPIAAHTLSGVEPDEMRWLPVAHGGTTWGLSEAMPIVVAPASQLDLVLELEINNAGNQINAGARVAILEVT